MSDKTDKLLARFQWVHENWMANETYDGSVAFRENAMAYNGQIAKYIAALPEIHTALILEAKENNRLKEENSFLRKTQWDLVTLSKPANGDKRILLVDDNGIMGIFSKRQMNDDGQEEWWIDGKRYSGSTVPTWFLELPPILRVDQTLGENFYTFFHRRNPE